MTALQAPKLDLSHMRGKVGRTSGTLPPLEASEEVSLPPLPEEPPLEAIEGVSELEDEQGDDTPFSSLRPKAAREAGLSGKTRVPTQKEKDYVDFILKAGAASTFIVSRLHHQSRNSTHRKLKWLKDNGFLALQEFTYGPPLWLPSSRREVYFSSVRHLYNDLPSSIDRIEHDQIVAYLAAEWVGGLTDSFGILGGPADPILQKVAEDSRTEKGARKRVTTADYARADAVRRKRLHATALTREVTKGVNVRKEDIKRTFRVNDLHCSKDDIADTFSRLKAQALAASGEKHFDVAATGHAYLHPVSHDAWMAGVPVRARDSFLGEAKIFEPDAVFFDGRVGRLAIEVERSPKNRNLWWDKLWAYYKHNVEVASLAIGGKTGGFYYDRVIYVFTDKTTKENFVGMLREARVAPPTRENMRQKELIKWLDEHKMLLVRDLRVPRDKWKSGSELVSLIDDGGALVL